MKELGKIIEENAKPIALLESKKARLFPLFAGGFIQVLLVSANTYFISQLSWLGIATTSFFVSYTWTMNVIRIKTGSISEKIAYSTGATIGGLIGVMLSSYILF
ncbi:MAG: hypothetical protein JW783_00495 [Bacteroidales bacterium]|jgi:hypothetical protein|nr:hypothetical protein [Bacteroidales bacterium]MBN2748500.1 hypothetical protein [Bacteroidales bacterium]